MNKIGKAVAAIGLAASMLILSACSSETPEPIETKNPSIVSTVDDQPFDSGNALKFEQLVPNQVQTKSLKITNEGDGPGAITEVTLVTSGNIFNSEGGATIVVEPIDGTPLAGRVIEPGETVEATIRLSTTDSLGQGLNGSVSLRVSTTSDTKKESEDSVE